MKSIKKCIYYIFKIIPSNLLLFISGIFVATGVNMITSSLPKSIITNDGMIILIALLFWIMAGILNRWALQINKFNLLTANKIKLLIDEFKEKELWFEIFTDPQYHGIKNSLLRCLLACIMLLGSIIILIILPIDL